MKNYDYFENVKEDVKEYLEENKEDLEGKNEDELYDELFIADSVTGNASGSYTFNTWEAEENLTHNFDLLQGALDMFGDTWENAINRGAEYCDVTIRCSLLGQALHEVLEENNL